MRKILFSLIAILLAVGLVGAGAFAYFSDTETSTGNQFTAGTLDLKVDTDPTSGETWSDDPLPNINSITELNAMVSNMKPGDSISGNFGIKNAGTIDGVADFYLTVTSNDDNGLTEPEKTAGDTSDGEGFGELARYIDVVLQYDDGTTLYPIHDNIFGWLHKNRKVAPVNLLAGQTASWVFVLSIDSSVGNIIQSDKLTFDIEFSLDQVTP